MFCHPVFRRKLKLLAFIAIAIAVASGIYLYFINWNRMKAVAAYDGLIIGMHINQCVENMAGNDYHVFDEENGRKLVRVFFNEEYYLFAYFDRDSRLVKKIVGENRLSELNIVEKMLQSLGLYQARLYRKQPDSIDYMYCPN